MNKTLAVVAGVLATAGVVVGVVVSQPSKCVAAPKGDVRCLQVEPFPPRYLGPGVPMLREASAGVACVPAECAP